MNQRYIFYYDTITLITCIVGMILSKSLISIGMVLLTFDFLFLGSWKEKWQKLKSQKVLLVVMLIYPALHIVSLLWSSNVTQGLIDINKKMALIVFPLTICAMSPLKKETFKYCFIVYLLAIFAATIWGSINFFTHNYIDTRTLMGGCSHVRFALNIVFAIICVAWIVYNKRRTLGNTLLCLLSIYVVWLGCYILFAQLTTAVVLLAIMTLIALPYYCIKKISSLVAKIVLLIYVGAILVSVFWIRKEYKYFFTPNVIYSQPLVKTTPQGNTYYFGSKEIIENGNYVYYFWNPDEMKTVWKQRTGEDIGDKFNVLLRYLNSISPYKDAQHVKALSNQDIDNINRGIANKAYINTFSLTPRLYKLFWQIGAYKGFGQVKNFSELQRLELWANATRVIRNNFLIGCGCGDVHSVFTEYLCRNKSQLCGMGLKAHNQYLYTFATFGLLGLVLFLFYLIYPPIRQGAFNSVIYCAFFFIVCASMISEDTLDSVQGIMFYIFLNSIMLFNSKQIIFPKALRRDNFA
jgi:O-Antigen ligase.